MTNDAAEIRRPARLAAGLAEWIWAQDPAEVQRAFRRAGLELAKHEDDYHYVHRYFGKSAHKLEAGLDDVDFMQIAREVSRQRRTYLYYDRLHTLYQAVRNVARLFPSGDLHMLEAGVFRGGSSFMLARAAERLAGAERVRLLAVDTFVGHDPRDLPGDAEGVHTVDKFMDTSAETVRDYLSPFPFVEVIEGRIGDVIDRLPPQLHLAHLDVDIEQPTRVGLELCKERLAPGGVAVIDDYGFKTCPGVKQAVDEFVATQAQEFSFYGLDTGQGLLLRNA